MIADYFYSVWNKAASPPPVLVAEEVPLDVLPTVQWVERALLQVHPRKSTGGDEIPGVFLKNTADILAPSLCHIFVRSLRSGEVPSEWKDAVVCPIPKTTCPTSPGDFRPISLLPVVSKVMEKWILTLLERYLFPDGSVSENLPISDLQFGFRKGRGTVDCLSYVVHDIAKKVDKSGRVACVFFDVKKAFDSCVHSLLLRKLEEEFRVPHYLLSWIRSYLVGRTFRVLSNGYYSERKAVLSGVPQGSVLGPSLYLAYSASLKSVRLSEGCNLYQFADDVCMAKSLPTESSIDEFQADVDSVEGSISTDLLELQPAKCSAMLLSVAPRACGLPKPLLLKGVPLPEVQEQKYLGAILDRKLSFVPHCRAATTKAKRAIHVLCRKFRGRAPSDMLKRVYSCCILPALLYGMVVVYPGNKYCRRELEKTQRLMARYLTRNYLDSYEVLLQRLGLIPIWKMVFWSQLELFRKLVSVPLFSHLLPPAQGRRSARLSHSKLIVFQFAKVSLRHLFFYRIVRVWNSLTEAQVSMTLTWFRSFIRSEPFLSRLGNLRDSAGNSLLPTVQVN